MNSRWFERTAKLLNGARNRGQQWRTSFSNFKLRRQFSYGNQSLQGIPVYWLLIGANVGIWALWNSNFINRNFMVKHFALSKATLAQGNIHAMITHGFSHINLWHLLMNMVTLYFFGRNIELVFGVKRLLQLYLAGTFFGGLFQLPRSNDFQITVGASGATSAILSYFILHFPNQIIYLYFIPVPAWAFGLLFLGYSYFQMDRNSGIAHAAHLGGLLSGAAIYFITRGRMF